MKKFLCILAACVLGLCALCACGGNEEPGGEKGDNEYTANGSYYNLERAYENGWLTKEDLESIAYYVNNYIDFPESMDEQISQMIREDAAIEMRNRDKHPTPEAQKEDFTIVNYYGVYSQCYCFTMDDIYTLYPTDIVDYWEEIAGVQFHITSRRAILAWKQGGAER